MQAPMAVLLVACGVALAACDAPTEPGDRVLLELAAFEVPPVAMFGDTVRVAFRYSAWCGPSPAMELTIEQGSVEVAVWASRAALDRPCIAIYPIAVRTEFLLPPQFLGAEKTIVRFRQPEGPDSLREIVTQAAALLAP